MSISFRKMCQLPILSPLHNFLDFNIYFEGSAHNIITHIIYSAIRLTFLISNLNFKDFYSLTISQPIFWIRNRFCWLQQNFQNGENFKEIETRQDGRACLQCFYSLINSIRIAFSTEGQLSNKLFFNSFQDRRIVKRFNLHNQKWKITVSQGL